MVATTTPAIILLLFNVFETRDNVGICHFYGWAKANNCNITTSSSYWKSRNMKGNQVILGGTDLFHQYASVLQFYYFILKAILIFK